jgi:hypothetical protein
MKYALPILAVICCFMIEFPTAIAFIIGSICFFHASKSWYEYHTVLIYHDFEGNRSQRRKKSNISDSHVRKKADNDFQIIYEKRKSAAKKIIRKNQN